MRIQRNNNKNKLWKNVTINYIISIGIKNVIKIASLVHYVDFTKDSLFKYEYSGDVKRNVPIYGLIKT